MSHIGSQDIRAWKKEIEDEGPVEEAHVSWSDRRRAEEKLTPLELELWKGCGYGRKQELIGQAQNLHKQSGHEKY